MADVTETPEELIGTFRELFPREHEIAMLTLMSRNQAEVIAQLERGEPEPASDGFTE